jgi:1-aminocyclopropane-1-carboxylate deaminase
MASGLAAALPDHVELWVFPVLKGGAFIHGEMKRLLMQLYWDEEVVEEKLEKVRIFDHYHFGGYGKVNDKLVAWINRVKTDNSIPLDPIYTAKAAWGLQTELACDNSSISKALLIHSGGLQGVEGFNEMRSKKGKSTIQ